LNSFGRIRGCDSADAAWWLARTTAAGTRVVAAGTGSSARRTGRMLPLLSESISQAHFNPQDWDGLISQAHFKNIGSAQIVDFWWFHHSRRS